MGVFDDKADDVITIRDEKNWEPHESATVRTVVKVSDFEWVQNQLVQIKQGALSQRRGAFQRDQAMNIQALTGASDRLWVFRMLKSWTFTKAGQPVELTLKNVQQLPQSVLNFIYNEIMKRQPKEEEESGPEFETEQKEEGSAFFDAASLSTAGDISSSDVKVQDESELPASRNFLPKS